MNKKENRIKLFEDKQVRHEWDSENEKWWFSIVDVCAVLTEQYDNLTARKYWNKLKQRLKDEGNQTVTNCHQLKLIAADGKMRLSDVADTEQVLRLIQSIPSKKVEPLNYGLQKLVVSVLTRPLIRNCRSTALFKIIAILGTVKTGSINGSSRLRFVKLSQTNGIKAVYNKAVNMQRLPT